jgi:hypothetical protein
MICEKNCGVLLEQLKNNRDLAKWNIEEATDPFNRLSGASQTMFDQAANHLGHVDEIKRNLFKRCIACPHASGAVDDWLEKGF